MRRTISMASRAACMRRKQAAHSSELRHIACRLSSAMLATGIAMPTPPAPSASHRSRAADGACVSAHALCHRRGPCDTMRPRLIITTNLGADALNEWCVFLRWSAGDDGYTCLQAVESHSTFPSRDHPRLCMSDVELQRNAHFSMKGGVLICRIWAHRIILSKPIMSRSTLCCRQNSVSFAVMGTKQEARR